MTLVKVKETPDFLRDMESQALVNKDSNALQAYRKRKQHQNSVINTVNEVAALKQEIGEIKDLLKQVLNKIGS